MGTGTQPIGYVRRGDWRILAWVLPIRMDCGSSGDHEINVFWLLFCFVLSFLCGERNKHFTGIHAIDNKKSTNRTERM